MNRRRIEIIVYYNKEFPVPSADALRRSVESAVGQHLLLDPDGDAVVEDFSFEVKEHW